MEDTLYIKDWTNKANELLIGFKGDKEAILSMAIQLWWRSPDSLRIESELETFIKQSIINNEA